MTSSGTKVRRTGLAGPLMRVFAALAIVGVVAPFVTQTSSREERLVQIVVKWNTDLGVLAGFDLGPKVHVLPFRSSESSGTQPYPHIGGALVPVGQTVYASVGPPDDADQAVNYECFIYEVRDDGSGTRILRNHSQARNGTFDAECEWEVGTEPEQIEHPPARV